MSRPAWGRVRLPHQHGSSLLGYRARVAVSPALDRLLGRAQDVARAAVAAAGAAGLRHWRRLERVETKQDGSPVTVADREAEAAAIGVIRAAFPDHGILGEEGGAQGGGPFRWVVDPIDGTAGYARGGRHWGPLVALEHEGEGVVGALSMPVAGLTIWGARGRGTFRDGERLRLTTPTSFPDATLSLGGMGRLLRSPQGPAVLSLVATARSTRVYGDLAACVMLLEGVADVWIEAGVAHWDLAAPKVLVEEAGGVFTDFEGRATARTGSAIAASAPIHAHMLAALLGDAPV